MVDSGDLSLIINVVALFLFAFGFASRKWTSGRVLIWHGVLSILAFIMKMVTVVFVMTPALASEPEFMTSGLTFGFWLIFAKVTVGIAGTVMSFVCIIPWFFQPLSELGCTRVSRWMLPTFAVWALSIILGSAVHFGDFM